MNKTIFTNEGIDILRNLKYWKLMNIDDDYIHFADKNNHKILAWSNIKQIAISQKYNSYYDTYYIKIVFFDGIEKDPLYYQDEPKNRKIFLQFEVKENKKDDKMDDMTAVERAKANNILPSKRVTVKKLPNNQLATDSIFDNQNGNDSEITISHKIFNMNLISINEDLVIDKRDITNKYDTEKVIIISVAKYYSMFLMDLNNASEEKLEEAKDIAIKINNIDAIISNKIDELYQRLDKQDKMIYSLLNTIQDLKYMLDTR